MSFSQLSKSACAVVTLHTNLLWPNVRRSVWWIAFVSLALQDWQTFGVDAPVITGFLSHLSCVFFLYLLHDHYSDFGPTLAAEKLRERHNIMVSVETLRKWMTADGLWVPYSRRRPRVHQPRYRRDCLGELIQIDGCEHRWFEERGPACTLLVYVDELAWWCMLFQSGLYANQTTRGVTIIMYAEPAGQNLKTLKNI